MEILAKYGGDTEYYGKLDPPKPLQRKLHLSKISPSKKRISPLSVFLIGEGR